MTLYKRVLRAWYNGALMYSDASIVLGITQKTFSLGAKIVAGSQNVAYAYPNRSSKSAAQAQLEEDKTKGVYYDLSARGTRSEHPSYSMGR